MWPKICPPGRFVFIYVPLVLLYVPSRLRGPRFVFRYVPFALFCEKVRFYLRCLAVPFPIYNCNFSTRGTKYVSAKRQKQYPSKPYTLHIVVHGKQISHIQKSDWSPHKQSLSLRIPKRIAAQIRVSKYGSPFFCNWFSSISCQ